MTQLHLPLRQTKPVLEKPRSPSVERRQKDSTPSSRVTATKTRNSKQPSKKKTASPKPTRPSEQQRSDKQKGTVGNHDNPPSRTTTVTKPKIVNKSQTKTPSVAKGDTTLPPVNAIPLAELEATLLTSDQWDSSEELELLSDEDLTGSRQATPTEPPPAITMVAPSTNERLDLLKSIWEDTKNLSATTKLVDMFSPPLALTTPSLDQTTPTLDQATPTSGPSGNESK